MKPKTRLVLEMAIKKGIECGWNRAQKYGETPDENEVKQKIEQNIWNFIYEWIDVLEKDEPFEKDRDWEAVAADQAMTIAMMKADCYGDGNVYRGVRSKNSETKTICLNREWVGLTDEEIVYEWELCRTSVPRYVGFARAIEAKLREKNHG